MSKRRGFTPLKTYYTRAKVFGVMMVLIAIGVIVITLFPGLVE